MAVLDMLGPYKLYAYGAAALLLVGAVVGLGTYEHHKGAQSVQDKWDASVARGKTEVVRLKAEAGKITVKTEIKYVDRVQTIHEKGATIVKQVEVFVPQPSVSHPVVLDGGFRVFHDAAVENRIPDPSEIPNATPVSPTEVASTIAGNYEKANVCYETVKAWQDWATAQCKLNDKGCPDGGQ